MVEKNGDCGLSIFSCQRACLARIIMGCGRLPQGVVTLALVLSVLPLMGQKFRFVPFQNPSLEGSPSRSLTPMHWFHCGAEGESPPDTQPSFFGHQPPAAHGRTYVGMVARENGTRESIGQQLDQRLEAGHCYEGGLYVARSDEYESASQLHSDTIKSYTTPLRLELYGGLTFCDDLELLAASPTVRSTDWHWYSFWIRAKNPLRTIVFQSGYDKDSSSYYNGNLLIDNIAPLVEVDCQTKTPFVEVDTILSPVIIEDWAEFLSGKGDKIMADKTLFVDAKGHYHYENVAIYKLLKALEADTSKKIVILIRSKVRRKQKLQLQERLRRLFYYHPSVIVRVSKRGMSRVKWVHKGADFELGIDRR